MFLKTTFHRAVCCQKIEASLSFLGNGGKRVVITNPESLKDAINNKQGTHIVNGLSLNRDVEVC